MVKAIKNIGGVSRPAIAAGTVGYVVKAGSWWRGRAVVQFQTKDTFMRDSHEVFVSVDEDEVIELGAGRDPFRF